MAKIIRPKKKANRASSVSSAPASSSRRRSSSSTAAKTTPAVSRSATARSASSNIKKNAAAASDNTPKAKHVTAASATRKASDVGSGPNGLGTPRKSGTYLQRTLVAYGQLHNPQQNQHGVNVIKIRNQMSDSGMDLKQPHRVLSIMHHLEDAGLLERHLNNYKLSDDGRARVAAAKKALAAEGEKVDHADERIWLRLSKEVPPMPNSTPESAPRVQRAQSAPAPAAQPSLLSRIWKKRAASQEDVGRGSDGNKKRRAADESEEEDNEVGAHDEGEDAAELVEEETVDALKGELARLRAEIARLKKKRTALASGYLSGSSLSSAPGEDGGDVVLDDMEPVPEEEPTDTVDDLIPDDTAAVAYDDKEDEGAEKMDDLFGGDKLDDDDWGGGMECQPEESSSYALSLPPALTDGGAELPSSSLAGALPSSPSADVASRLLARVQPLSAQASQHSQQRTPSASPQAGVNKDDAAPVAEAERDDSADLLQTLGARDVVEAVPIAKQWKAKLSEQEKRLSDQEAQVREPAGATQSLVQLQTAKDLLQEEATRIQVDKTALQASLASVQQANADFQSEIASLRAVNSSKTAEVAKLAQQIGVLEADAEANLLASNKQLMALKNELVACEQAEVGLRESLSAEQSQLAMTLQTLAGLEAKVESAQTELAATQASWDSDKLLVQELQNELKDKSVELQMTQLSKHGLHADLVAKASECSSLTADVLRLNGDLDGVKAARLQLEKDLEAKTAESGARTTEVAALKDEVGKLRVTVDTLTTERDGVLQSNKDQSAFIASLTKDLDDTHATAEAREASLATALSDVAKKAQELESVNMQLVAARHDLTQSQLMLEASKVAEDRLSKQAMMLESEIETLKNERDAAFGSRDEAVISASNLKDKLQKVDQDLSEALASQAATKAEADASRIRVDVLTAELAGAQQATAEVDAKLSDVQRQLLEASHKLEQIHALSTRTACTLETPSPAPPAAVADPTVASSSTDSGPLIDLA